MLIDPGRLLFAEGSDNQATVALAHEALIQEWPALSKWLEHYHDRMQQIQGHLLGLGSPVPKERQQAAESLGRVGPAAAEAVPALLKVLADTSRQSTILAARAAAKAIGKIGAPAAIPAVPALLEVLRWMGASRCALSKHSGELGQ
jgi:HEAT repeats